MYYKYVRERYKRLTNFDKIRRLKLIEIIQYTILYTIVTLPLSAILEEIFPEPDETKNKWIILLEVLLQTMMIAILVFYIQKFVKLIPFIYMGDKEYKEHKIFEYQGDITISIIFVGTQKNLFEKIHILRRYIASLLF